MPVMPMLPTWLLPRLVCWKKWKENLALEITKRIGANIIDTNQAVRAVVERMQRDWPAAIKVNFSQDESEDVTQLLGDLQNNVSAASCW